jgi:protein-S-isoprenylcysteine O-methyltransferase Ste14
MQRFAVLIYGVLCYLLFLVTFCYAIGFVGNLWVPKSMDVGGEPATGLGGWLINALLLGLFAIQHAIMARPAFKAWWVRIIPAPAERPTFVLATCICLCLMYWQWRPMTDVIWSVDNAAGSFLLQALFWAGWGIVLVSTFLINHFDLFGLRQPWLAFKGRTNLPGPFVTRGLYKLVRHPLMLGFLIAFWATPHMTAGHLLFACMTTGYIYVSVYFLEERDLMRFHPAEYAEYRRTTPGILPIPRFLRPGSSADKIEAAAN